VTDLDGPSFEALFDAFRATAARLETLPAYAVGGAEGKRLDAWRRGLPRPERSVRTDPWLARIATSTVSDGKSWRRVRVFDDPPTDYQRYQVDSYREAQAVGDQVLIASRAGVDESVVDVWVFDQGHHDAHAVVMHYDRDGGVERRELITDPASVAGLAGQMERVAAKALPFNEWLAAAGVRRLG
jgi:hypothetical protein